MPEKSVIVLQNSPVAIAMKEGLIDKLEQVFKAAGGGLESGKYNIQEFAEYLDRDDWDDFPDDLEKFKAWDALIKRVKKYPQLIYVFLYALFVTIKNKKIANIPLIISKDTGWVFKDVYDQFKQPAYLAGGWAYEKFIQGSKVLGRPSNTKGKKNEIYASEENELTSVLAEISQAPTFDQQCDIFADKMGFDREYMKKQDAIYKLTLCPSKTGATAEALNLSGDIADRFKDFMPTGNEASSNDHWVPGGMAEGGLPEIVLYDIPNTQDYVKKVMVLKKTIEGKFDNKLEDVTSKHKFQ